MNKVPLSTLSLRQTYDAAFSASHALHFNACQQLAHVTSYSRGAYE